MLTLLTRSATHRTLDLLLKAPRLITRPLKVSTSPFLRVTVAHILTLALSSGRSIRIELAGLERHIDVECTGLVDHKELSRLISRRVRSFNQLPPVLRPTSTMGKAVLTEKVSKFLARCVQVRLLTICCFADAASRCQDVWISFRLVA